MANFCRNCGARLNTDDRNCPYCGTPTENVTENTGNGQYNNGQYNGQYGGYNNEQYGGYNNSQYNNGQYGYPPYFPQKQRKTSVGLVIFSVINIILGCGGINLILGIIALVYTLQAKNATTDDEEASKNRTALILNVVAVCLLVISFISLVALGVLSALLY